VNSRTLIAVALVCCGCSRSDDELPRAAVHGRVTWQGTPLSEGIIRFVPLEKGKGGKTSVNIHDGAFEVDAYNGPVVGEHRIEIASTDDGGFAMDDEKAFERLRELKIRKFDVVIIPPIYNLRSILTETVSADSPNQFDFQLTKPKRR